MSIYDDLGVAAVINGVGPATRLGGLPMAPEVWEAMQLATETPVHVADLQRGAGAELARLLGAPAAYVTSGAFAALALAAAVCMTSAEPAAIDQLPRTRGIPHRFLIQRAQRDPYDRAIEVAGGRLHEIGYPGTTHPAELEAGLARPTAGILYRPGYQGNLLGLGEVCEIAHRHGVAVIVDGALVVPPLTTLSELLDAGADLIAVSGGKGFRGPQASGLLLGRADLISSVELHHQDMDERASTWHRAPGSPPRHGIGRGMKTGREQIVGLLTAVRRYVRNPGADDVAGVAELDAASELLTADPRVSLERSTDPHLGVPILAIAFPERPGGVDDVVRGLLELPVPVHLGQGRADTGTLVINPMALQPGHGPAVATSILTVLDQLT